MVRDVLSPDKPSDRPRSLHRVDIQSAMNSLRDTPVGQILRRTGFKSQLLCPEEQEGFQPTQVLHAKGDIENQQIVSTTPSSEYKESATPLPNGVLEAADASAGSSLNMEKIRTKDGEMEALIVDWYDEKDAANPRNWSTRKKAWVTLVITYVSHSILAVKTLTGLQSLHFRRLRSIVDHCTCKWIYHAEIRCRRSHRPTDIVYVRCWLWLGAHAILTA
jgi:hypothetical protein